jgi:hypothetical protein
MSSMSEIAAQGIGPTTCLRIWGEARERNQGMLPEAWGWPGCGIEYRLKHFGHGAKEPGKQPELTSPESALESLESFRAIAEWTDQMLRDLTPQQRIALHLRYVRGKCYQDIAKQMTEGDEVTADQVGKWLEAGKLRIKRALAAISPKDRAA